MCKQCLCIIIHTWEGPQHKPGLIFFYEKPKYRDDRGSVVRQASNFHQNMRTSCGQTGGRTEICGSTGGRSLSLDKGEGWYKKKVSSTQQGGFKCASLTGASMTRRREVSKKYSFFLQNTPKSNFRRRIVFLHEN